MSPGGGHALTDIRVRDLPDDVVAGLKARATRLGLSRSEYLRRRLTQDAHSASVPVTADDLVAFADAFVDLADPEVMKAAWQ